MRAPGSHHDDRTVDPVTGERVVHTGGVDSRALEDVRRDAYQRGVADERARHKRNPLVTLLIALVAVLGIAVIVLALWKGSFSEAGRTLDQTTDTVAQEAREAGREVADESGEAMQDAGRTIEQRGEGGQAQTPPPAETPTAAPPPAETR